MRTYRRLAGAFDAVAEATVVPSFSRMGIAVRSRLERWEAPPSMTGQVALVTGATSGIGLAAAIAMAELGASVHMVGRDAGRGRTAQAAVERAGGADVHLDLVDMGDAEAVAAFGRRFLEGHDRLAVLVHNAGALSRAYKQTARGVESTVAVQVLGPYVLTAILAPLLCRSAPSRIVMVSSGGMYMQRFDLGALEMPADEYDGVVAYARAKRAGLVLAEGWARNLGAGGVASYAMHPGWVDTPGLKSGLPRFQALLRPILRTPAEGADTIVWLATGGLCAAGSRAADSPAGGGMGRSWPGLFHDRRRRSDHRLPVMTPTRPGDAEALMAWCAARTAVDPPTLTTVEK